MATIVFIEQQKLRHNLLWSVALISPLLALISLLVYQYSTGILVGDKPMSNLSLLILIFCYGTPAVLILLYVRLTTIISDESISYGWNIPIKDLNVIKLEAIKSCEVIEYGFVGWGYRITKRYGTVFNVDGSKGLQIETKSGYKVLIGTDHAEELKKMIEEIGFGNAKQD